MKSLVACFSASGVTMNVAIKIKDIVSGDLFEIEPTEKYTSEDLDWMNKSSRSSVEMSDDNSRPKIKSRVKNIDDYNKVYIGFPVWWYTAPRIINTFIEENNLEGKGIYIFVTSGGSDVTDSFSDLKNMYPNLNFISGKRIVDNNDIIEWIR